MPCFGVLGFGLWAETLNTAKPGLEGLRLLSGKVWSWKLEVLGSMIGIRSVSLLAGYWVAGYLMRDLAIVASTG